jgi:hypothetical protein
MREVGILPQFTGTLVRDGYLSYTRFEGCRRALCNAHLLRELVFVAETDPAQAAWTKPLASLLLEIKEAASGARAAGNAQFGEEAKGAYLRRYDRLVKRADRLNRQPYASLSVRGSHIVIRKERGRPKGRDHINGIEGFWSAAHAAARSSLKN